MAIPKLKFTVGKVNDYYSIIEYFLSSGGRDMFLRLYPNMPEQDQKQFFINKEKKFLPIMEKVKQEFENSWDKINDEAFNKLSKIMEEDWSNRFEEFTSRITLLPICPRYLDYGAFDLNFNFADRTMKTMCLHELSHFLFFQKVTRLYPDADKKDFEKPGVWWKLSEIIPGVIFQGFDVFEIQDEVIVYDHIRKYEVDGQRILDIFKELFEQSANFDEFIHRGINFLNIHEVSI